MRRAVLIPTLLMCAACSRSTAVTTRVQADRPLADARTCSLYRLQSLGYTIMENKTSSNSVEGVKAAQPPEKTSDRIDVVITDNNNDRVPVGRPNNTLAITAHTVDQNGRELPASGNVQADAANVSIACSKQ
jgi:hypothetical protein